MDTMVTMAKYDFQSLCDVFTFLNIRVLFFSVDDDSLGDIGLFQKSYFPLKILINWAFIWIKALQIGHFNSTLISLLIALVMTFVKQLEHVCFIFNLHFPFVVLINRFLVPEAKICSFYKFIVKVGFLFKN